MSAGGDSSGFSGGGNGGDGGDGGGGGGPWQDPVNGGLTITRPSSSDPNSAGLPAGVEGFIYTDMFSRGSLSPNASVDTGGSATKVSL